jgi:DNA repair protein RecO (recombination protein O)
MPLLEAEAVVLRQYALFDADRIIVLFSREFGTLRAVAQGIRRPRSRMGACLEPLTHIRLHFFQKEGVGLARIRQCEILHSYLGKNPSVDRVFGFSYLAELTQEIAPEGSPNPLMFRLLLAVLEAGAGAAAQPSLLRYFEFWTLKLNGWLPNYDYCSICGKYVKDDGFFAWVEAGQGRCRGCAEDRGVRIRAESVHLLREILELSPMQFVSRPHSGAAERNLEHLAQKLIEWHLEKPLKSYHAWKAIMRGGSVI